MARPPSAEARAALLRATAELIAEQGIDGVTVDGIAQRSGVAKTTLYRQFGGLDALVFETVSAEVGELAVPDTGTLRGDLAAVHRQYLAIAGDPAHRAVFAWMLARALAHPDGAARFRAARFQPGPTAAVLRRAVARGELPADIDVELAMHVVQGPLISMRIIDDQPLDDAAVDALVDMTVRALGGPRALVRPATRPAAGSGPPPR